MSKNPFSSEKLERSMAQRKRIAFIVEPLFMYHHVGVRNYIYSLYTLLAHEHHVDFISSYRTPSGRDHWYRLIPKRASTIAGNGLADDAVIRGTPSQVSSNSSRYLRDVKATTPDDFHHSHIGSDLAIEEFDIAIISNPWLVNFEKRLPCKKLVGMVYDTVPNEYVFTRDDKPFAFASLHQKGFQYYKEFCDNILAISPKAADDVQTMFKIEGSQVHALPPVLPPTYAKIAEATNERGRRVALASPFDKRKGLAIMPGILNEAKDSIDTLSIYGGIRCTRREMMQFFDELSVKNVEWYPNATAGIVKQLFLDAKALLFPSFDEGLGLPILESQFCGCRALVRNKLPMSELVGPGHGFVVDDPKTDGQTLSRMLTESFDHKELQSWAVAQFNSQFVQNVLNQVLFNGDQGQTEKRPVNLKLIA